MATRAWQPGENGNSFKIIILAVLFFSFGKKEEITNRESIVGTMQFVL